MHNNNNNNIHVCISHELHIFFRTKNAKNSPHLIFYTFHSILMYVEGPNSKVHPFDITYNFFLLQNIKKMTAAALKKDGQEFFISSKKIRMNDAYNFC